MNLVILIHKLGCSKSFLDKLYVANLEEGKIILPYNNLDNILFKSYSTINITKITINTSKYLTVGINDVSVPLINSYDLLVTFSSVI